MVAGSGMNYHLSQNGRDAGAFPLEELRRRRASGELNGSEPVWTDGMAQWEPLDSVLAQAQPGAPSFIMPPPLPPPRRSGLPMPVAVLAVVSIALFVAFSLAVGWGVFRTVRLLPRIRQGQAISFNDGTSAAMAAATKPVVGDANTRTWAEVQKVDREFRRRQYLEGYQLRGIRNPECDRLALGFLTNWIGFNFDGPMDTNLPPLAELGDRLANDPACQDPVVLTVAGVNEVERREASRRLERALQAFKGSKHRAYPEFYATVILTRYLIEDKTNRLAWLDGQALQRLKTAFADGSLQPADQAEVADELVDGWGDEFFKRNAEAVTALAQDQGESYLWLALVLAGDKEINAAWAARGGGWADSVSSSGWTAFYTHLAAARKSLTRAWRLEPRRPRAPALMMTVALGTSGVTEMREWFDRTTEIQLDYAPAWREMRWGLRPRWFGDDASMLAFGGTALKTGRFDTDVPRMFFDSVSDLEAERGLPPGKHLYSDSNVWAQLQQMYEGYLGEPTISANSKAGWRSSYAAVAYLAGQYDAARKELEPLDWQPRPGSLNGWGRDLSLLAGEVAARTGPQAAQVNDAEHWRETGDVTGALLLYRPLETAGNLDARTRAFVQDRLATLAREQELQKGQWVDFLPSDTHFTGWHVSFGDFRPQPDGALEVHSDENGHLIFSRVRVGPEFEIRGRFEVVSSSTAAFQAGLVMGLPQWNDGAWYAFRMKRNRDEGDVASFSRQWTTRQFPALVPLNGRETTFDLRFQAGRLTADVNGARVFDGIRPPAGENVNTNELYLGLGAFNDSNTTVVRYRQVQVRRLLKPE